MGASSSAGVSAGASGDDCGRFGVSRLSQRVTSMTPWAPRSASIITWLTRG